MKEQPFNRDWCLSIAQGQLNSIQQALRMLKFCMEKDPDAVKQVLGGLEADHPLREVLKDYL